MDESKLPRPARHGYFRLKARLALRGWDAIDLRSGPARSILEWRTTVINQLGGIDNVTPAMMKVIEEASITAALIGHSNAFLLTQESVINRREKRFIPLVLQRQSISGAIRFVGLGTRSRPICANIWHRLLTIAERVLAIEAEDAARENVEAETEASTDV